ncbi:MAG: hypothetical protein EOO52_13470 [Gammaproteobacteria bacterium]|nr:MAG: hypothetical protein EOO52_13470 [Gammaproteobacteria bacterium]
MNQDSSKTNSSCVAKKSLTAFIPTLLAGLSCTAYANSLEAVSTSIDSILFSDEMVVLMCVLLPIFAIVVIVLHDLDSWTSSNINSQPHINLGERISGDAPNNPDAESAPSIDNPPVATTDAVKRKVFLE